MQWGAFRVDVSADGRAFALGGSGATWARFELDGLTPAGRITDDPDETEHGFTLGSAVGAVRHGVAENWTLRLALSAQEGATIDDPPRLRISPQPGYVAWVWAAGAEGLIAVAPTRRAGPVIGLRLMQGWLGAMSGGLRLGPPGLGLRPGHRWVGTLRGELYGGINAIEARLPRWLTPLELTAGQPWEFHDPDQALVVQPPATTRSEGEVLQVLAPPGRAGIALHSPRGLTSLNLSVAPTLDTLLAAGAARVLAGSEPVSPGGAFVVAEALGRSLISEPSAAEQFLDDAAWHSDDLLAIAATVVRGQRTGNARTIRSALTRLGRVHPQLGYGRVVMTAWLACLALGEDASEAGMALLSRPGTTDWVALELQALGLRSVEVSGGLFAGLINALGGDLPGEPVGLTSVLQAQLVGLLQLCPEEWPMAPAAASCAQKSSRRLLAGLASARFDDPDDLAVLAWLALGQSLV